MIKKVQILPAFALGQIVCFKTDVAKTPFVVAGYEVYGTENIYYLLTHSGSVPKPYSEHEIEVSSLSDYDPAKNTIISFEQEEEEGDDE